ncbi:MAG: ATP-binding protein [Thermodesulfovibrionales bacterium]|jgi:signal transduction histidine kinase
MKDFTLGFKFSLIVWVILLIFWAFLTVVSSSFLRVQVVSNANEKLATIMTSVKAVNDYSRMVSAGLPDGAGQGEGLQKAIAIAHPDLELMSVLNRQAPLYRFSMVSDRPLNPQSRTDESSMQILKTFRNSRGSGTWSGVVKIGGETYLSYAMPVICEKECVRCHGKKDSGPEGLSARYRQGEFGWEEGSVVGVVSVATPLSYVVSNVKRISRDIFLLGIAAIGILFLAIYITFSALVRKPLDRISSLFRAIAQGKEPLGKSIPNTRGDEIGELIDSFNILGSHLLTAQERLKKTAELERQMMETEKFAALGQLSAGIAHEINNPLGGIRLCFNNLMDTPMDEETRGQHIEVINSGFERIKNIVKQLLDLSRSSELYPSSASINTIVESVVTLTEYTAKKKGIIILTDLSNEMPEIMLDTHKLEQVFLNLILNAIHAMEGSPEGVLTIRTWCDERECHVSFQDTGKGIPPEITSLIFDPFFTTKGAGEGTGLGLTVSKAIIEQHKGEIKVMTSEKGTTFTISLPVGN